MPNKSVHKYTVGGILRSDFTQPHTVEDPALPTSVWRGSGPFPTALVEVQPQD